MGTQALSQAILPGSVQSEQTKMRAVCFSLKRENIGLVIQNYNFSEGCPKNWLLTCLPQSDEGA